MPKFINKKALSMKVVKTCNTKCILRTAWKGEKELVISDYLLEAL